MKAGTVPEAQKFYMLWLPTVTVNLFAIASCHTRIECHPVPETLQNRSNVEITSYSSPGNQQDCIRRFFPIGSVKEKRYGKWNNLPSTKFSSAKTAVSKRYVSGVALQMIRGYKPCPLSCVGPGTGRLETKHARYAIGMTFGWCSMQNVPQKPEAKILENDIIVEW